MKGAALALALALIAPTAVADPAFTPGGEAQISAIGDHATIDLADGRMLRLVGIDVPAHGALARAAKDALRALLSGGTIGLRFAGNPRDRQGRVLAQAYAGKVWIEGALLRRGLARVRSTADERVGVAAMLGIEREARRHRRGIWADQRYAVIGAENAAKFAQSFQVLTGTVIHVGRGAGLIYLDFGAMRAHALVAIIDPAAAKLFKKAGIDPMRFVGKRLRLRGYIDARYHPTVTITHPEQIEILDATDAAPAQTPTSR